MAPSAIQLPNPVVLERICKGIAALDAMLCSAWESRYYSFNAAWAPEGKERLASMRNGSGDDWCIVFEEARVFVKSLWHEHPREDVAAIYAGIPTALNHHLTEPTFGMTDVTFGGFHDGAAWTLRGNAEPLTDELAILSGDAAAYHAYAADYFDANVPVDAIAQVLAGKRLDAALVARISTERTLADLEDDLAEIGYGK